MKLLLCCGFIGMMSFLASCALLDGAASNTDRQDVVRSQVTAYTDENFRGALTHSTTLNFRQPTGDDVRFRSDVQDIIKSCRDAAEVLGFKTVVDNKNCKGCVDVLTMKKFEKSIIQGEPETHCSSYYGSYFGSANCYTYRPAYSSNDRWIGLTFFDHQSGTSIHQIDVYSNGYIQSVVQVSKEMCYAALKSFPRKFENETYEISRGLELERKPVSEADSK